MKLNNVEKTLVNVLSKEEAKELSYAALIAKDGEPISMNSLYVYSYEGDICIRVGSDELFKGISLPLAATQWKEGEAVAKATVEQTMELMAIATAERVENTVSNGWTLKKVFYTYQALREIGVLDEVLEVALNIEAGEVASEKDEWITALSKFDEETAAAQNGIEIAVPEGAKISLYAYNQNGDYRFTTYKMSLKGVCGKSALAEKYPLFERYASNSQDVKDAEKFDALIERAEELLK